MRGPKANDRRSPLPRRTGHGDFPHPAFAQVVSSRKHSQGNQSQMVQVRIQADTHTGSPAPLTASAQVHPQPKPHEVVQVPKRRPRIAQAKVIGPASQVPIQSPNQLRQGGVWLR